LEIGRTINTQLLLTNRLAQLNFGMNIGRSWIPILQNSSKTKSSANSKILKNTPTINFFNVMSALLLLVAFSGFARAIFLPINRGRTTSTY